MIGFWLALGFGLALVTSCKGITEPEVVCSWLTLRPVTVRMEGNPTPYVVEGKFRSCPEPGATPTVFLGAQPSVTFTVELDPRKGRR